MRRALFAREFRSALLPNLVTVGAILATLVILERIYGLRLGKAGDIREFTDLALLVGLVVSGFISGERCFPGELKESRMLFLSSLPISRSWVWLSIISARLLAALISVVLAIALRRPFLVLPAYTLLQIDTALVIGLVLFTYLLFFSAGTLFALLFRRTLFSYVAGFLGLGFLLTETFFPCSYPTTFPLTLFTDLTGVPGSLPSPFILAFLSLLLASSLLGSWWLFIRGEIGNSKQRTRSQLLFGITAAAYLCVLFCIMDNPRLASVGSHWIAKSPLPSTVDYGIPYSVSPDGRYLAVSESSNDRPFLFRVNVVDTQTGHILGRSFFEGVSWVYWSSSGDILNLVALNNSPLDRWGYLAPATVDWIRLSPDTREISRRRLQGAEELAILAGGRCLAIREEGDQGRIDLLDGTSGRSSEIARAPLDGSVKVTVDGPAALVYFNNVLLPSRAWIVDSMAHEVRIPRSVPETQWVLFGEVARSPSEARNAILRRFAPPLTPGGAPVQGNLILPPEYYLWIFNTGPDAKGLYFSEENTSGTTSLWARPTAPEGRWEKLPELAPKLLHPDRYGFQLSFLIYFPSGVAALLSKEDDGSFFVYDPRVGVIHRAGSCPQGNKTSLTLSRVAGLRGLLIKLSCTDSSFQGQTHYFEYVPGSRDLRAIKTVATRPDFMSMSHLYLDERGADVWVTFDEDIWSSALGRKDLLLWRGQRDPSP
jgi:hypothetical protein